MPLPRRVLSAAGALCLLLTSALPARAQAPNVAEDAAVARLNAHIALIAARSGDMNALYQNKNFGGAIDERLTAAGARYTTPDGHILRWRWSHYGIGYYDRHIDALKESIKVVQTQHYATPADMDYLDRGMAAWQQHELRVREVFDKEFAVLVGFLKNGSGYIQYSEQTAFDPDRLAERQVFEPLRPGKPESTIITFPGARPGSGWW